MSSSDLIPWGGIAAMVAGTLVIVLVLLSKVLPEGFFFVFILVFLLLVVALLGLITLGYNEPTPSDPVAGNPFEGETVYVSPTNPARQTADQWYAQGRTADAKQLEKIAKTGVSRWIPVSNPYTVTYGYVSAAQNAGQLPIVVLYNIPARDCGSYSGQGAGPADAYRSYVDEISRAIGERKAVVIIEPDALAQLATCLDAVGQRERLDLLKYAVDKFKANNTSVDAYLDAGNSRWHPASTMIDRLKRAGVANARGFSLNVSGFGYTSEHITYGKRISAGVGGKHFVIDTSRNGNGPYRGGTHAGNCPSWANPPGRALGERPTHLTDDPVADAYVWVKFPGESDAACGGYPKAGGWAPEYALGLTKNRQECRLACIELKAP